MPDRYPNRETVLQHLAQAERHVAQGEKHIAQQEGLIAEIDRDGRDTTDAKAILETMRQTQALHRQSIERILKELEC